MSISNDIPQNEATGNAPAVDPTPDEVESVRRRAADLYRNLPDGAEHEGDVPAVIAQWRDALPPHAPSDQSDRVVLCVALATSEFLASKEVAMDRHDIPLGPCMSVDAYLAAHGVTNGIAKRRRTKMVKVLRQLMDPRDRDAVKVNPMVVAEVWHWPLSALVNAHAQVEAEEDMEPPPVDPAEQAAMEELARDPEMVMRMGLHHELEQLSAALHGMSLDRDEEQDIRVYLDRMGAHLDSVHPNE